MKGLSEECNTLWKKKKTVRTKLGMQDFNDSLRKSLEFFLICRRAGILL